jgi:DNA transformation protein and related proteins
MRFWRSRGVRENAHHFDARDLEPFVVDIGGKLTRMSYRRAPDEVLDDPDAAAEWGRIAFEAALRARRGKGKAKRGARGKGKCGR